MNLSQKLSIIIILAFAFSLNAGIASMHTDDMGNMTDCPFMGMDAICQMNPFEHITTVQIMFTGIPAKSIGLAILSLILIISFTAIPRINSPPNRFRFFINEISSLPSPNRILAALSDGRIQPKLYA